MAYVITTTNGKIYATLGEGVIDDSLGVALIGQNYHNYGQHIANNFVRLLEHQASDTPPLNPIAGQIWWSTKEHVLYFFDGNRFKPCSSSAIGIDPPVKPLDGDQWWDTVNDQLRIYTGTEWRVIGPLYTKAQGFTGIIPVTISDISFPIASHTVSKLQVNGITVGIISSDDEFPVASGIEGIYSHSVRNATNNTYEYRISPGITLASNAVLYGTTVNAQQLDGVDAANYLRKDVASSVINGSIAVKGLSGVSVGTQSSLALYEDTSGIHHIDSPSANLTISSGSASITLSSIDGSVQSSLIPVNDADITNKLYVDSTITSTDQATRNYIDNQLSAVAGTAPGSISSLSVLSQALNNDSLFYVNNNAALALKADKNSPALTGLPTATTAPAADSTTRIATTEFVHSVLNSGVNVNALTSALLPATDNAIDIGSQTLRFRNIYGTAMSSKYADLAEKYTSDIDYLPGHVLIFGGSKEVTKSTRYCDPRIAGVVSESPAYLMNDRSPGVPVALTGKVACKVYGPVKKGAMLVSSEFPGIAKVLVTQADWAPGCVIGKSLEDSNESGIHSVMISVGRF
jgi:hypothetical protein